MTREPWYPWARCLSNKNMLIIQTVSGYGMMITDNKGEEIHLAPDVPDEALGEAVLKALAASREIPPKEMGAFRSRNSFEDWVTATMQCYGYKRKTSLYQKLKNVGIGHWRGTYEFNPSRHVRGAAWDGFSDNRDVVIPDTSTTAEIGFALRVALERSIG